VLEEVRTVADTKLGKDAPGFGNLREAISVYQQLVQTLLQQKPPANGQPVPGAAPAAAAAGTAAPVPQATVVTREQLYDQLATAARKLRDIEPHSLIPYLIERAVALGRMEAPKLFESIIRNADVLKELKREFGIVDEPKK
jgi:type VI secretion system protein ImpA